ncbi:hypothetical protein V8J82_05340 [Gymnodinialimonas sp. 2305UL16-5]|uniref:hypothetical protein n=1 Tax=Gymnodinialimonas mytili TaxID=3126503 RepID=UPI00309CD497
MDKKFGTLAALSTLVAGLASPDPTAAQQLQGLLDINQQCGAINEIEDDRTALQRELDLLLNNGPGSLLCSPGASEAQRQQCIDQCVAALASLLDISPVAELPPDVDPY